MKLFITDIDDTLSVGEVVSKEVRDAFSRLREAGWDVMIATGRTYGSARGHMEAIGVTRPSILYNGGRIMDRKGHPLVSVRMDHSLAHRILDFLWGLPLELQVAGDECIYCREQDSETRRFFAAAGPIHLIDRPEVPDPVFRVCVWTKENEMEHMAALLTDRFGTEAEVCPGGTQFIDIQPKGTSKGTGLDLLLRDFFDERPEVILAAGDHKNDQEILKRADFSACPVNAFPALLETADFIFPPARRHGIRFLIDRILEPGFELRRRREGPFVIEQKVRREGAA